MRRRFILLFFAYASFVYGAITPRSAAPSNTLGQPSRLEPCPTEGMGAVSME